MTHVSPDSSARLPDVGTAGLSDGVTEHAHGHHTGRPVVGAGYRHWENERAGPGDRRVLVSRSSPDRRILCSQEKPASGYPYLRRVIHRR
ncbi:hypothetical protein Airi02_019720 [Actinoallomurus iriomotensis]|uniref:Uncharacterized protein n=1 Tax=Actinoallomurus iriomotensis TaxID=478107 RepID=A0A9W6RYQ9_9ACTN|nr:hypothetical protein Airi02_019720 [Actinoallomurus iriomotensis]